MGPEINKLIVKRQKKLSAIASAFTLSIGVIVFTGWLLGIEQLKSVIPSFVSMKVNTSLAFIFISSALLLTMSEKSRRREKLKRGVVNLLIVLTFSIGFITLIEYITGFDLLIDEVLFRDSSASVLTQSPGRMSLNTALGFIQVSFTLILYNTKTRWGIIIGQFLSIFLILLSVLPLFGYIYGFPELYGLFSTTKMAIHTAFAFLTLGFALAITRPGEGILAILSYDSLAGYIARRLLPVTLLIPILPVWYRVLLENWGFLTRRVISRWEQSFLFLQFFCFYGGSSDRYTG